MPATARDAEAAARDRKGTAIRAPDSDTDGDTAFDFLPDGRTRIQGEWDLGEGDGSFTLESFLGGLEAALAGEDTALYLNIHTEADGAGAIRGHVVAVPEPGVVAQLLLGLGALGAWRERELRVRRR